MSAPAGPPPAVIGWREYVALPEWGVRRVKAKADTGARSSALDVEDLVVGPDDVARFRVATTRQRAIKWVEVEAPVVRRTRVKSSFGHSHDRLFVETEILLAGVRFRAEIGLVSRHAMLCPMLLGRKSLEHRFVVDPAHTYLHGRSHRRAAGATPGEEP